MTKESYVKPDVSSEVLEPGALAQSGSGNGGGGGGSSPWLEAVNPSFGVCCD